jgi:cytochrome d ubiquinol oxidase subunit II
VPLLTALVAVLLWRAVLKDRELAPFLLALSFFGLGFIGLVAGIWPNIVPPDMTLWEAAAPPSSQGFMLVGTAVMIPTVLAYTAYSYRVFRGKVVAGEGYH